MVKYSTPITILVPLLIFDIMLATSFTGLQQEAGSIKAYPVTGRLERLSVIDKQVLSESIKVSGPGFTMTTAEAGLQKAWFIVRVSFGFERKPAILFFDQISLSSPLKERIPLSFFRSDSGFPFKKSGKGSGSFNIVGADGEAHEIWSYVVDSGALEGKDRYGLVFFEADADIELVFLIDQQVKKYCLSIADSKVELSQ